MQEEIIIEPASNGFIANNNKGVKLIGKTTDELVKLIADQTGKAIEKQMFGKGSVKLTLTVETIVTPKNN